MQICSDIYLQIFLLIVFRCELKIILKGLVHTRFCHSHLNYLFYVLKINWVLYFGNFIFFSCLILKLILIFFISVVKYIFGQTEYTLHAQRVLDLFVFICIELLYEFVKYIFLVFLKIYFLFYRYRWVVYFIFYLIQIFFYFIFVYHCLIIIYNINLKKF